MNPRALLALALLSACGAEEPPPQPVEDPCPHISLDTLPGRWIKVEGKKGDHTHRFEVVQGGAPGTTGAEPELWYTGGGFTKKRLVGERRSGDYVFTEVPTARKQAAYEAGTEGLLRLYVEPWKKQCSLRVTEVSVLLKDGAQVEQPKQGFAEYLPFPEGTPFTFRPCDGELYLGPAAQKRKVAEQQASKLGGPDPAIGLGDAVPVAAWTRIEEDGDPSCTYDMDIFFDDRPAKDKDGQVREKLAAGPAQDGWRHWSVGDWYAPYSGNHHFQVYRYRSCGGADRELIGVSCLEAVLQ